MDSSQVKTGSYGDIGEVTDVRGERDMVVQIEIVRWR
jgi:hypothetical protein